MKGFDAIPDDQDRYLKTVTYVNDLDSIKLAYLATEINVYILQSLLGWWASYCKEGKKVEGYHVVALIWTTVRSICASNLPVTKDVVQHVTKVCSLLGIPDVFKSLDIATADRKLSFAFKYPSQTQTLRIEVSQKEFQLNYCGPYMDRMLDAKPDPRVSSFVPDGWQRDVLDQLDANKSVFVVAPTSAGKTFISFYAMEQVLRADNDGVLVYVAPTKALVNQIAAEVQGEQPLDALQFLFITKILRSLFEEVPASRQGRMGNSYSGLSREQFNRLPDFSDSSAHPSNNAAVTIKRQSLGSQGTSNHL